MSHSFLIFNTEIPRVTFTSGAVWKPAGWRCWASLYIVVTLGIVAEHCEGLTMPIMDPPP